MAVIDDLLMLAMAIAVAAVALVCVLVALYLWALKRKQENDEVRGSNGRDAIDSTEPEGREVGQPPSSGPGDA